MTDTTYNGWCNYETWLIKLWIDNDEPFYNTVQTVACGYAGDPHGLAKWLENWHDRTASDKLGGNMTGPIADLVSASLREVNWYEIAESILGDIETNEGGK